MFGISYLVMMAGGSPPPALYEHADGGRYKGEWLGPRKQGLGTYTYPSGGQYQGMWRNNLKEGYGVYTFPKVPFWNLVHIDGGLPQLYSRGRIRTEMLSRRGRTASISYKRCHSSDGLQWAPWGPKYSQSTWSLIPVLL